MNIKQKKAENVILYFANSTEDKTIDRLKLMKLIWLSDRIHLNKYGRTILKDSYKALPNGPVASYVFDMSKKSLPNSYEVDNYTIIPKKEFDSDFFSKTNLQILKYVADNYEKRSSFILRDFSHEFPEWKRYEESLFDKSFPNSYAMEMKDFFIEVENNFSDILTKEEIELSKEEYENHTKIQQFLKS
jgi:uncharacterized phage-associated protein